MTSNNTQRLGQDEYRLLRLAVLERDGWRCQQCGSMCNLEVHHLTFRSRRGSDSLENLIALCADCHRYAHAGLD